MGNSDAIQALSILTNAINKAHGVNIASRERRLDREFTRKAQDKRDQITVLNHMITLNERKSDRLQTNLSNYENKYLETTGELYKLSDDQKSSGVNKVTKISGHIVNDLNSLLSELKQDNVSNADQLVKLKQDLVNIASLQSFYKGVGHTYQGGMDPEKWDTGDFTDEELNAYISNIPSLEGVKTRPFFAGVKAKEASQVDTNIMALNKILTEANITRMREERYEQILDKGGNADKTNKAEVKKADEWYRQKLHSMDVRNEVRETQQLGLLALDPDGIYGGIQDTEQNPDFASYLDAKSSVIKKLSTLLGTPPTGELYNEYTRMLNEAEGTVQGGKYSKGDFTSYHNFVDKAYQNYINSGKSESIEMIAQNIFGFSVPFDQFYITEQEQFKNQLLIPLEESGQVDPGTIKSLSDDMDWDNIFKDKDE